MLQTTCHPCVSGCGRYLVPGDGHDRCLTCLGSKHAEVAFVDEASSHGGKMIILELLGAYGSCGGSDAAGAASYETASTLAPWPSPEVGVVTRHSPGPSHTGLPPNPHPVVRPFVSLGRSAPGTGL